MQTFTYDPDDVALHETKRGAVEVLVTVLGFIAASLVFAIVLYVVFALCFSTDTERRLKQENRMYAKFYDEMLEDDRLLANVITGLEIRDNDIYRQIFKADAPSLEMLTSFDSFVDALDDAKIGTLTEMRLNVLEAHFSRIEDNFMEVFAALENEEMSAPPMSMPLKGFNYSYTGASVGSKINPFNKVFSEHTGIDLIASAGTEVYAAGEGIVLNVNKMGRKEGNAVEVSHEGGYITRYEHLDEIYVRIGSRVNENSVLGTVGVSGMSFAPHLHYEVIRDGEIVNPMNYFFADLRSEEYTGMFMLAATIGQSMD